MQIYTHLYKFIYALYIAAYDYSYISCKYELDLTEFKRFGYNLLITSMYLFSNSSVSFVISYLYWGSV
jgi:hypothetical protein